MDKETLAVIGAAVLGGLVLGLKEGLGVGVSTGNQSTGGAEITLDAYFMGRREQYPKDFTQDIQQNAIELLRRVNGLLAELGINKVKISSGWRPPKLNKDFGGAKNSSHLFGMAVDIKDPNNQQLAKQILANKNLLEKYDLYLENPKYTSVWVHLQSRRVPSGNRVFTP